MVGNTEWEDIPYNNHFLDITDDLGCSKMKNTIITGDALEVLKTLPDESINMSITSPPYWQQRDYGVDGQIGIELSSQQYVDKLIKVFTEIKRLLKPDGTFWVNIGNTYNNKHLSTIPFDLATKLSNIFIFRNSIIWEKANCIPEACTDRFTNSYEYLFFFSKNPEYYFEQQLESSVMSLEDRENRAKYGMKNTKSDGKGNIRGTELTNSEFSDKFIKESRNMRNVWKLPTSQTKVKHLAAYPEQLIERPILAGCPSGGIVLDPFLGSGTTAIVAKKLGRYYLGIELNPEYVEIAQSQLNSTLGYVPNPWKSLGL